MKIYFNLNYCLSLLLYKILLIRNMVSALNKFNNINNIPSYRWDNVPYYIFDPKLFKMYNNCICSPLHPDACKISWTNTHVFYYYHNYSYYLLMYVTSISSIIIIVENYYGGSILFLSLFLLLCYLYIILTIVL